MTSKNPPVNCHICDNCSCYCSKQVDSLIRDVDTAVLMERIIEIKQREEYLQFLRQKLEEEIKNNSYRKFLEL